MMLVPVTFSWWGCDVTTAYPDPPRVFISYARGDVAHEKQVEEFWRFLRANGIDAAIDRSEGDQATDWAQWMTRQVRDAQFVLVIASPEYHRLADGDPGPQVRRGVQWEARLIQERLYADPEGIRAVVPVLLPGGSAHDIPGWLNPTDRTHFVISAFTVAGAESLLRLLTNQPREAEPLLGPALDFARLRPPSTPEAPASTPEAPASAEGPPKVGWLSVSTSKVVARAVAMAGSYPVDASVVLLATLRFCYEVRHPGIPGAVLDALAFRPPKAGGVQGFLNRLEAVLGVASGASPAPSDAVQASMSTPPLSLLLDVAADVAERTSGRREVHLRHLTLATVLARNPPISGVMLAELGVSAAELRAVVHEASLTRENRGGDSAGSWDALLQYALASRLAGGIDADLVDPTRGIPLDRDDLDVGVWVSMLAAVIVDAGTPMPLSVGIFGEWGSGKSYFMGLLRSEITRLSGSGRKPYLRDVVQIGFNAWHYADANLWASLGDEIFRQLAGPAETADESRRKLREELAKGTAERQALEARTEQARAETVRLQAELEQAMAQRGSEAVGLLTAAGAAGFGQRLDQVWRRIGIRDRARQAQVLAGQVRGTAEEIHPVRGKLAQPRTLIAAGIGAVALAAIVAAVWLPASWTKWLAGSGAAVLVAAVTTVVTLLTQARQGLDGLKSIAAELSGALAPAAGQPPPPVQQAIDRLRRAEAAEKVAQAQLDEVVTQVGQLARQLSDLMPGQRLYAFLAERAASGPYAGQLGLISTIRKDFEHLVELLSDWHREGDAEPAPRPIDRIVLYIDDLDRCRPQQVVEVLQAVHLLLALDLFVVVVGVDPRWLVRSLQHQFQDNIDTESGAAPAPREPWNVTPHNYLEKIFNIPFALPGIPAGGLGRVLRGMSGANGARDLTGEAPLGQAPRLAGTGDGEPGDLGSATAAGAGMPVEAQSELAASRAERPEEPPRPLADQELELLGALEAFIGTPREAKRLFNLYRMLRSTRDLSDASSFLGDGYTPGEYQAVATLLGMLTANARLLEKVIDAPPRADPPTAGGLASRPAGDTWQVLAAGLTPVPVGDGWLNQIIGKIPADEVAEWRQFAEAATRLGNVITLPDLSAFQRWAPRIRRFSFLLSGLTAGLPADAPHQVLPPQSAPSSGQAAPR
jgi:KAP-like P-loop domain-containing protein/TIR domain-containing protein